MISQPWQTRTKDKQIKIEKGEREKPNFDEFARNGQYSNAKQLS